jgi:hypothetical protein
LRAIVPRKVDLPAKANAEPHSPPLVVCSWCSSSRQPLSLAAECYFRTKHRLRSDIKSRAQRLGRLHSLSRYRILRASKRKRGTLSFINLHHARLLLITLHALSWHQLYPQKARECAKRVDWSDTRARRITTRGRGAIARACVWFPPLTRAPLQRVITTVVRTTASFLSRWLSR